MINKSLNEKLLVDTLGLYKEVKKIYEESGYEKDYHLNVFWANDNMKTMLHILNNSSNAEEVIHRAQKTWMFSVNTAAPIKEKTMDWLLDEQQKRGIGLFKMDASVQESGFSNPENNVLRKNRILTPDFLRTVNIANEITQYCKINRSTPAIVELGAGCGHLARTIRWFIPKCSYVIIDIPETLCFSYMFLKLNFPEAKTIYITDENQVKTCSLENCDYILIPTKFREAILDNEFDLFINTASLGEMKNDVIRSWMDFIQNRLKVRYIFSLNRYLNTINTDGTMDWRLDENECSVSYDSRWKILHWELEPSFTRCPYMDTIIARYLEIVAERIPALAIDERKEYSKLLLLEIMNEDWFRLAESFPPEMTYRDNILVNDLTMDGTLFKLWESIRLDANELNVSTMLQYLETLIHKHNKEFEETYYYEKLFNSLFVSKDNKALLKIYDSVVQKRHYRDLLLQSPPSLFSPISSSKSPRLIEENYFGFNILLYGRKYYAFAQSLGPIDLLLIEEREIKEYQECGKCVVGNSLYEAKHLMDQMVCKALEKEVETLHKALDESESKIRNLQSMIGERDTRNVSLQMVIDDQIKRIETLEAEIIEQDQRIKALQYQPKVELVAEVMDYNIVKADNRFLAFAKSLGKLSPLVDRLGEREITPMILVGNSLDEVRRQAEAASKTAAELRQKEEAYGRLEAEVGERDKRIESMSADIESREEVISYLRDEVADKNESIMRLNEEVVSRDRSTEVLQREVAARDLRIDGMQKEVSEKDGNIKGLKAELENRDESIETLQKELGELENRIESMCADIASKDQAIRSLEADITTQDTRINELESAVLLREARLAARRNK